MHFMKTKYIFCIIISATTFKMLQQTQRNLVWTKCQATCVKQVTRHENWIRALLGMTLSEEEKTSLRHGFNLQ